MKASLQGDQPSLTLKVDLFSEREKFSSRINAEHGEGGGLNLNLRDADALCCVCNILGKVGDLSYPWDFCFDWRNSEGIVLRFKDEATRDRAARTLEEFVIHPREAA